jgi:hypothetical protein
VSKPALSFFKFSLINFFSSEVGHGSVSRLLTNYGSQV